MISYYDVTLHFNTWKSIKQYLQLHAKPSEHYQHWDKLVWGDSHQKKTST